MVQQHGHALWGIMRAAYDGAMVHGFQLGRSLMHVVVGVDVGALFGLALRG